MLFLERRFWLGVFFSGISLIAWSKSDSLRTSETLSIPTLIPTLQEVYREHLFLAFLQTDGWGLGYEYTFGKVHQARKHIGFVFSERKHPKEKAIDFATPVSTNQGNFSIRYGKQNICYPLYVYYGQTIPLGIPNQVRGVGIDAFYNIGVSLAVLRPYYIALVDTSTQNDPTKTVYLKYSQKDSILFFESSKYKATTYLKGLDELSAIVGLHAMLGVGVDFGNRFSKVMLLGFRTSVQVEWYAHELPIMVPKPNVLNDAFFVSGRLTLYIGKQNTIQKLIKK